MLTKFLILVVVCNSAASQLLLKRAVNDIGAPSANPGLLQFFVAAAGNRCLSGYRWCCRSSATRSGSSC